MKRINLLLSLLLLLSASVRAQAPASTNPFPKTITVTGSAEMEVIPDEIYVQVTLREYQKKGQDKKDLEAIKSRFLAACRETGLPDSAVTISSYSGGNDYYYFLKKYRKIPDLLSSITYEVKFSTNTQMDALVEKLDDEATQDFVIVSTSHSNITAFRRQLKIQAVKAAKEKATYLTEAINEKLGNAITITEPEENGLQPFNIRNGWAANTNELYRDEEKKGTAVVQFKKLKLRYEVSIIFALQ